MTEFTFPKKIESLQVLRFVLALGVFLSHFNSLAELGIGFSMPVYLFYTISGFIIMLSTRDKSRCRRFLPRRLIRLLPLYWLLTAAVFLGAKIVPDLIGYTPTLGQMIKSMLCLPFSRASQMSDSERLRPLVGPAHTLEVEVLFTLVFALCLLISHKHRGKLAVGFCSLAFILGEQDKFFNLYDFKTDFGLFYFKHTRSGWLYFILGILLYSIFDRFERKKTSPAKVRAFAISCGAAWILSLIWLIFYYHKTDGFMLQFDVWLIVQAFGGAALIGLLVFISSVGVKTPKALVFFGDMSFSFFLTHYFVVRITENLLGVDSFSPKAVAAVIIALALSFIAALVCYKLIEKRFSTWLLRVFKVSPKKDENSVSAQRQ